MTNLVFISNMHAIFFSSESLEIALMFIVFDRNCKMSKSICLAFPV